MLSAAGLSAEEEAVYLALLDASPATETQVLQRVPGTRVRLAMSALEAAGLVSRLTGHPVRYQPAPPQIALEVLVRAREQELQHVRLHTAQLSDRYREGRGATRPAEEVVEVVTTREAVLQRWVQLHRGARRELRAFDRPPYSMDAQASHPAEDLLAAGVSVRCVYARAGLELPGRLDGLRRLVAAGERARVTADVPVKMLLADDSIGLISLERSADGALVIHASSLLDTLRALFEAVWAQAVPLRLEADDQAGERDSEDQKLLSLLAMGLTDEAIARQLGRHSRTVQRHLRRLMNDLGAETRFQAGLQAARLGRL
jgi:DNA-binding NarL/FixJ family response regulator